MSLFGQAGSQHAAEDILRKLNQLEQEHSINGETMALVVIQKLRDFIQGIISSAKDGWY